MLEIRDVSVQFAGLTALRDVSFQVPPGQVCTVMGPNGAGKTTLFNAITGFVRPSAGTVAYEGETISGMPPHRIAARGIRRTFQNNGIMKEMSVLENVLTGLQLGTGSTLAGIVLGTSGSVAAEREAVRRARATLAEMGIAALEDRTAGDLSFGQQRMVEVARAMVASTRLVMLDEPAVGLSPLERVQLGQSLRKLAGSGVAVLLVEHVQDLVMAVSDRVVVLNYGRKIAECAPDELRQNRSVLEAYLGYA
jgi:branched-chain amino acid transport system ATP-binding protein